MARTIMLIHGAWLNSRAWEGFKARYEARGLTVLTPDWPYDDRPPEALRASPDPRLARTGQKAIIDHHDRLVRALPEPPILIGHSFGGVIVQHLADRGLGAAAVAIDPAPTPGVPLGPHAIASALPVLWNPFTGGQLKVMSRRHFATRFAQTAPRDQVDALYDRYVVPTAGRVYWDGIFKAAGTINWRNPARPPMLLIGGGLDLIADASMTRAIYQKQKQAPSPTELKIFPDRSHWTGIDAGWEEVADHALDWALAHADGRKTGAPD